MLVNFPVKKRKRLSSRKVFFKFKDFIFILHIKFMNLWIAGGKFLLFFSFSFYGKRREKKHWMENVFWCVTRLTTLKLFFFLLNLFGKCLFRAAGRGLNCEKYWGWIWDWRRFYMGPLLKLDLDLIWGWCYATYGFGDYVLRIIIGQTTRSTPKPLNL